MARPLLKNWLVLNPAAVDCSKSKSDRADFWFRLLNDQSLEEFDDLEKLVIGCEIIAVLDALDLLAA